MKMTTAKVKLPWWYWILVHIPILNLLYSRKMSVTFRLSRLNGDPIRSIFVKTRILKFGPKTIDIQYLLDEYMIGRQNYITLVYGTATMIDKPFVYQAEETGDQKEFHRYGEDSELRPNIWYTQKLDISKVLKEW